jgi:hypothetical protein
MKTRRFLTLIATALAGIALLGSEASAKRPAPAEVQSVVCEGIEY